MTQIEWSEILSAELKKTASHFAPDELAYLALTSKIELPFRDRLAFRLHQELATRPGFSVSREWNRVDLAVLSNRQPEMLLELKAMYSFDMHGKTASTHFPSAIQSDAEKLLRISASYPESPPSLFTLLLATHPHSPPPNSLDSVIKYAAGIRSRTPASIETLATGVREHFHLHPVIANDRLNCGSAFGINVSICYWLFGPYVVQPNNSYMDSPPNSRN